MDIYLREQVLRDDTLDPAYFKNRIGQDRGAGGTVDDATVAALTSSINSLSTRTSTLETKVYQQGNKISSLEESQRQQDEKISALETSQTTQDGKISTLETSQSTQDGKISVLETSQTVQNERLDSIEEDIEDIKEQLENIGASKIIEYVSSVIGLDIPVSIQDDPDALSNWLGEQDNGDGIDLVSLAERIRNIEENIITNEEIEALFQ